MKLIAVKCPQCGADLQIEEDQRICFCEYCGCRILIDDVDERSEQAENHNSADRHIDETRAREAELQNERERRREEECRAKELVKEQKRSRRRKRRRIILLVILALIVYVVISAQINTMKRNRLIASLTTSLNSKLAGTDAAVNDVYLSGKTFYVDLDAATTQKDRIDELQKDVVSVMDSFAGYGMRLDFLKDYSTVRSVDINENGIVKVWTDKTDTLSEEDIKSICSAYEAYVQAGLDGTDFTLFEINYEGDQVYTHIETDTYYRVPVKKTVDAIAAVTEIQQEIPLILRYSYKQKTRLADFTISSGGRVQEDNSALNNIPDEEKDAIEQEYISALKEVCRRNDASLTSVEMSNDCLHVEINTASEKKNDVEKFEREIDTAIEGLTPADTKIELNHGYSSVKDWTIDRKGLKEVTLDLTD